MYNLIKMKKSLSLNDRANIGERTSNSERKFAVIQVTKIVPARVPNHFGLMVQCVFAAIAGGDAGSSPAGVLPFPPIQMAVTYVRTQKTRKYD
jgi:hypothetical protein